MTQDRSLWRSRIKVTNHMRLAFSPTFGCCSSSEYSSAMLVVSLSRIVRISCRFLNLALIAYVISPRWLQCRLILVTLVVGCRLSLKVCSTLIPQFKCCYLKVLVPMIVSLLCKLFFKPLLEKNKII